MRHALFVLVVVLTAACAQHRPPASPSEDFMRFEGRQCQLEPSAVVLPGKNNGYHQQAAKACGHKVGQYEIYTEEVTLFGHFLVTTYRLDNTSDCTLHFRFVVSSRPDVGSNINELAVEPKKTLYTSALSGSIFRLPATMAENQRVFVEVSGSMDHCQ